MIKPDLKNVDRDTTKTHRNELTKGKIKYEPEEVLMGQPAVIDESENIDHNDSLLTISCETPPNEETIIFNDEMVDGEIEWIPEFEDFIDDTTQTGSIEKVDLLEEKHVKGEIYMPAAITEEPVEIDTNSTSRIELNNAAFDMIFESILFPNPVKDQTTIVINVKNEQLFSIYLYAINGKMVKDIYNGMLATGRQEFRLDLSQYQSGSYLVVINAGKQKESLKLEKLR